MDIYLLVGMKKQRTSHANRQESCNLKKSFKYAHIGIFCLADLSSKHEFTVMSVKCYEIALRQHLFYLSGCLTSNRSVV